jgi:hypothetical protein
MEQSPSPKNPGKRKRRLFVPVLIVAVIVTVTFLALVLVPARADARVLTVSPGAPAVTTFSVHGPSWVTIHFDRHGSAGMMYWMDGPSGMMFNRSMMDEGGMMGGGHGSDSYSFWTWGGDYRCGAEYSGSGSGSMPVWVNMTSAVL